jgi:hypothetical protein
MNLLERCYKCGRLLIFEFGRDKARGSTYKKGKWHDYCSKCVMNTIIEELKR